MTINLRDVRGYAMSNVPNQIQLRNIAGYAMVPFSPLPLGQSIPTALMNMILANQKASRPASHFVLGAVEVGTVEGYNSKVKLTPTAAAQLRGEMYFHYNRIHMTRIPDLSSITFSGATSTHGLIAKINTLTNLQLTTADIVDEPIAAGLTETTLTAAATSYLFMPGSQTQVGNTTLLSSLFKTDTILWT